MGTIWRIRMELSKEAARQAITSLIGVKGVSNKINIKSQLDTKIDKRLLGLH
jgi:hypothetical protein